MIPKSQNYWIGNYLVPSSKQMLHIFYSNANSNQSIIPKFDFCQNHLVNVSFAWKILNMTLINTIQIW